MISKNYLSLTPLERVMYIGELTHACMNDDDLFVMGKELINLGVTKGVFTNVKIMPPTENKENDTEK